MPNAIIVNYLNDLIEKNRRKVLILHINKIKIKKRLKFLKHISNILNAKQSEIVK